MRWLPTIPLLMALSLSAPSTMQAADPVTPEEIRSHIYFLAHDLLTGRGIGTTGESIATAYIETIFTAAGLEPAFGDSYLQEMTLRRVEADPSASLRFLGHPTTSRPFTSGQDFVIISPLADGRQRIDAELVYVGYGIVSERWKWDDYKGVDLDGKVVVVHVNEPRPDLPELFEGRALTYYGRWTYKLEEAARQGALGALLIHTTEDAGYDWTVVSNSWSSGGFFDPDSPNLLHLQGWVSHEVAGKLVELAGHRLDELRAQAQQRSFQPVPLSVSLELTLDCPVTTISTYNVAGIARGSGPANGNRAIVISAHHDHFGQRPAVPGKPDEDTIFNGALDNGSALAAMLALARTIGRDAGELTHDVIFLACAAEEEGLLGSAYFARNPPVPASQITANINFELTNVWGRTSDLIAIGARHSDLSEIIAQVAAAHDMTISPESAPEQGYFFRSDQLSFARAGIPAVWLDCGEQLIGQPPGTGAGLRQAYRENAYHRPGDELDPSWELTGTVQLTELTTAIIRAIDSRGTPLRWKPESSFRRPAAPAERK